MSVSFANDIRPLFRPKDINAMKNFGGFDLSLFEDVKANYAAIIERLEAGSMPCDGKWPNESVELFQCWIKGGMEP